MPSARTYQILAGSYSPDLILYTFDPAAGILTTGKNVTLIQSYSPSWLAQHPKDKNVILAVSEGDPGKVATARLEDKPEKLTVLSDEETGGPGTASAGFSRDGSKALASNYLGGSSRGYKVGRDGKLSPVGASIKFAGTGPNTERQEQPHPHDAHAHPRDPSIFYVPDLGADRVRQLKVSDSGTEQVGEFSTPAGSGPRHIVFHPKHDIAYVVTELSNEVLIFALESSGALSLLGQTSFLPEGAKGTWNGAEIAITSDGRHLYASNRNLSPGVDADPIAAFNVSSDGKSLRLIGQYGAGGNQPRAFKLFGEQEQYLIVGNTFEKAPSAVVLERDVRSGALKEAARLDGQAPTAFIWIE